MEYLTPDSALQQAEAANPILGNPLLLLAILLFLAVLPRALRHILSQKEKTALDKAVERFEKEELLVSAVSELNENNTRQEKPHSPKDGSLAYLMEDGPASQEMQEDGSIPPFPVGEEEDEEEKDELVKIVKEGVPISHNEVMDFPPPPKKKVKLIKQEISIAPDANKASSKNASPEPLKGKKSSATTKDPQSKLDGEIHEPPVSATESEEPDDNWVEAEIPGLVMDSPPAAEQSENIPTFKASPKTKHQPEPGETQKPPHKEKQGAKVKKIASKSEERKDSKPKKLVKIKTDAPGLKIGIPESKPKVVEIKAPVVSHKNIAKKETEQKKAKEPISKAGKTLKTEPGVKAVSPQRKDIKTSAKKAKKAKAPASKTGKTQKTEPEVTAVPPQRENIKTSPEKAKPKPFLLDVKYLDQEELEEDVDTATPVSHEPLPSNMVDVVIARLNALQNDLENQLLLVPGEQIPKENPVTENMREDQIQDPLPVSEEAINDLPDKKEVSLEELDSFLFTSTQRKNK